MLHLRILIILISILPLLGWSQGVKGKTIDSSGHPIPYATIFVKELTQGTTSNSEGNYEIKLQPGTFNIQYRSMGYNPAALSVTIGQATIEKNMVLTEQLFQLQQITVYASRENPAYPIMRRAISMAPYYLNQVKSYKANVYLKGTARLEKIPRILRNKLNLNVNGATLKEGELFVGENISEINFTAPDQYKQKIISSNISLMDNQGQPFDMGLITSSPYQPQIDYLIMPLSPQAFSHYKFSLVGTFTDSGYLINKIKVTPRRESKQLVRGYLFIVDGLWSIHSLELSNEQIFGTITTKMIYNEVIDNVWLPMSHAISVDGKMMGVKGKANYTSSVKYRNVEINKQLAVPSILTQFYEDQEVEASFNVAERTKRQKKMDELMKKEKLSNREALRLASMMEKEIKQSQPKDTVSSMEIKDNYEIEKADSFSQRPADYWEQFRPNPLTSEELHKFQQADSIRLTQVARPDSTLNPHRKNPIYKKALFGTKWLSSDSIFKIKYNGLLVINTIGFNAVEGFRYGQQLQWGIDPKKTGSLNGKLDLSYAFGMNTLQWKHRLIWNYNTLNLSNAWFFVGNEIADFNYDLGVTPVINALSSLLFKTNYARYFRNEFIEIGHSFEVMNGLKLNTEFLVSNRSKLVNHTNFSLYNQNETYRPNTIIDHQGNIADDSPNRSAIFTLSAEYTPFRPYVVRNGVKSPRWSKWPTLTTTYKHAQNNLLLSNTNWNYIEGRVDQRIATGAYSRFNYQIRSGIFLTHDQLPFHDFATIETAESPVEMRNLVNSFRLLPHYQYNPNQWFNEVHLTYITPYLLLKYLPKLSETMWREQLHFNYLNMPGFRNYYEVGYSIGDIGYIGEVGIFAGFEGDRFRRIGISTSIRF